MLKYIKRIPTINSRISEKDLSKFTFPALIGAIFDIRLENDIKGTVLSYKNESFSNATNAVADKNDKIIVLFSTIDLPNVRATLEISEITTYSCGIKELMILRAYRHRFDYGLGGAKLNIMDRTYYADDLNPAKLFIDISSDILAIVADKVVLRNLTYISND